MSDALASTLSAALSTARSHGNQPARIVVFEMSPNESDGPYALTSVVNHTVLYEDEWFVKVKPHTETLANANALTVTRRNHAGSLRDESSLGMGATVVQWISPWRRLWLRIWSKGPFVMKPKSFVQAVFLTGNTAMVSGIVTDVRAHIVKGTGLFSWLGWHLYQGYMVWSHILHVDESHFDKVLAELADDSDDADDPQGVLRRSNIARRRT